MSESPARARRKPVKLYYFGQSFYVKNSRKMWMNIAEGVAKHYLIKAGFTGGKSIMDLTPADNQLLLIRDRDAVDFVGDVAGHKTGLLEYNGRRVLVQSQCALPIAKKGPFPRFEEILTTMLDDALPYVLEWHRQAHLRVFNGGGPMLPALALAGATGTGKSLIGKFLTVPLLGGRFATPTKYLTGETRFTANICGSETLLLDDIPSRMQKDSLNSFQGLLKEMIAAPFAEVEPKGKEPFSVPVIRAILICMNQEPHNFRILPLDDGDLDDKLMLVHVRARPACLPSTNTPGGEAKLAQELARELPHLLWHILHDFKMPKAKLWERGAPCFRDPALLGAAFENDSVSRVLWLFDKVPLLTTQEKTAHELDAYLRDELGALAANILDNGKYPLNLGAILRSAQNRYPDRVVKAKGERHGGVSKWVVKRAVKRAAGEKEA